MLQLSAFYRDANNRNTPPHILYPPVFRYLSGSMQDNHKTVGGLKDQGLFSLLHISCGHVEFERMMILQERSRTLKSPTEWVHF